MGSFVQGHDSLQSFTAQMRICCMSALCPVLLGSWGHREAWTLSSTSGCSGLGRPKADTPPVKRLGPGPYVVQSTVEEGGGRGSFIEEVLPEQGFEG